ncbi:NAD(P)/FAD-dependent oxidoreductase [Magnetospirillum sp. UT-4]|uniref:NAD(P)/FAD-dependent oxidoreductase n=1 Tax=Magnetospirillum sp. UT-4 TaxID=2681467 RepID=UPI001380DB52|nr:NAD(P)/FAD-dependent oxidoreductase [Magnetospirillum sp. UT-4]CAA7613633.1 Sulfide dehydrogenase (flavocytochrome c) flavoprotein chain [Magnetospirillum sp. UT-4]
MTNISRRTFNGLLGAAGAVTMAGSLSACTSGPKVVVVGGGFGGATAAKYVKRYDPSFDVTLIDADKSHFTCPFSNAVIGGLKDMSYIERKFDALVNKHGVKVFNDMVVAVDPVAKVVKTKSGQTFAYDRLILSPGIDFKWNAIAGYDEAASQIMPHAWKAGPQTALLKKQLEAMPAGGLVVISAPGNPFRCPPGPYERASLIAGYLKKNKPKSKLLILDSKDAFAKDKLFKEGWEKLYDDIIEWVPAAKNGKVAKVDAKAGVVETDFEKFKPNVANIIPPQMAGTIAQTAGLTDKSGFCPVDPNTFESTIHKGIHVIGDACIAGEMPKSGYSASSQAKVAAAAAIALIKGEKPLQFSAINTCYSLLAADYGISVAAVFAVTDGKIAGVKGAGGVSPMGANYQFRKKEADYADGWYQSVCQDTWA